MLSRMSASVSRQTGSMWGLLVQPSRQASVAAYLNKPLSESDPEMHRIIQDERNRQAVSICLIPSENYTSYAVQEAIGSCLSNKYSEGYPGLRYYGGNQFIDQSENLCIQRALDVFHLGNDKWGVNVQPHSGAVANFYVYTALLRPHDRLMGLDLPHGGHLSHGYQTAKKKISAVSTYFESMPYRLNEQTGLIDYDKLEELATIYRPKIIVAGASAYSRLIDYARIRKICDSVDAYLLADVAHISGLIAAKAIPSAFDHADIVTTTTHKSLRGPRGAMIFYRKGVRSTDAKGNATQYDLDEKINFAVFPGHQGGPHQHSIAALSVALKQALEPAFQEYQHTVLRNSKFLTQQLVDRGYNIVSGGTDNHLCLVNLKNRGVDGARVERVLEEASITVNKNSVPGDVSALVPGGIRLGTPAITTRGMVEKDMPVVAEFIHRGVQIAKALKDEQGPSGKLKNFFEGLKTSEKTIKAIADLRKDVESFTAQFPMIGH